MRLTARTRLGPYEVLELVGAGGMGEVYKARDTRLDRFVAVKVLPPQLAADCQFRERFDREARVISQLDHPHICALYDVGEQDGTAFLVMQYLEGETLAQRLERGPLPPREALTVAIQIVDALGKAHRAGIVHRDLKPGNIMLTNNGPKLLDFGLAKTGASVVQGARMSVLPTTPPSLTAHGAIIGTFQYMAPEQLEGIDADPRTDIWAFGCIVYEMVTGRKPFDGTSTASLVSSILRDTPRAIDELTPVAPPALDRVVATCLAKAPDDRFQTAHDLLLQLRWIAQGSADGVPATTGSSAFRERLVGAAAAALLLVAGVEGWMLTRSAPAPPFVLRTALNPPDDTWFLTFGNAALSPDGTKLAFVTLSRNGTDSLWVQSLQDGTSRLLARGSVRQGRSAFPFWSPDGRQLGFTDAEQKLKIISAGGGPTQVIADVQLGGLSTWSARGLILFNPGPNAGIFGVPTTGGTPAPVTTLDTARRETMHAWPHFLPDGRHFVFLVITAGSESAPAGADLYVASVDGPGKQLIVRNASNASYVSPGYLLFVRDGAVMAQRFDIERLQSIGQPIAMGIDHVNYDKWSHLADFSAADDVLVTQPSVAAMSRLAWVDRAGRELGAIGEPGYYSSPRLSSDGRRVSVFRFDPATQDGDIWIYETSRGTATRVTFSPAWYGAAVWSPDGTGLAASTNRRGLFDLFATPAGGGLEQMLFTSPHIKNVADWSPDNRWLLFDDLDPRMGYDIHLLPVAGDHKPSLFLQTPYFEQGGRFSPDSRWVAYESNESGQNQVYVRAANGQSAKWLVSRGGGEQPRWRSDARELFYLSGDRRVIAVPIASGREFDAGAPAILFGLREGSYDIPINYEVAPDGQRFLINMPTGTRQALPMTVVSHWTGLLPK